MAKRAQSGSKSAESAPVETEPTAVVELRAEARRLLREGAPEWVIESIAAQLGVMREAKALLDRDGVVVKDGKDNPIPHPALRVQSDAQDQIAGLSRRWLRG